MLSIGYASISICFSKHISGEWVEFMRFISADLRMNSEGSSGMVYFLHKMLCYLRIGETPGEVPGHSG